MAVADLIAKVRTKGREAAKSARELAVSIVEGADVADETITETCREAGLAYEHFADLVAKAEARKLAFDTFHARDYDAEMSKATTDYKQTVADKASVEKEIEALRGELRRLGELEQGLVGKRHRIEAEKREAVKAFQDALGVNRRDWRVF
jgi:hypothetical protein